MAYLAIFFTEDHISIPMVLSIPYTLFYIVPTLFKGNFSLEIIIPILILVGVVSLTISCIRNNFTSDKVLLPISIGLMFLPIAEFIYSLLSGKELIGSMGIILFIVPALIFAFLIGLTLLKVFVLGQK